MRYEEADSSTAILGACLLYSDEAKTITEQLRQEYFYGQDLLIFKAIQRIIGQGGMPDMLTVSKSLPSNMIGEIASLTSKACSIKAIDYHVSKIREAHRKTILHYATTQIAEQAGSMTSQQIADALDKAMGVMLNDLDVGYIDAQRYCLELTNYLEDVYHNRIPPGIETGLYDVDAKTGGFRKGELIFIGARPSIGKTAFMLSIAYRMMQHKIKVGIFSAEMSKIQLGKRLISIASGEQLRTIDAGIPKSKSGAAKIASMAHALLDIGEKESIYLNDQPNIPLNDLLRNARKMVRVDGVKIIFVDYLSLITTDDTKSPLWERIGAITAKLKQLSRELNVPVVCLSQVTRDTEGKEPTLAHLRYSGSVEQDADVVIFLHREREEGEEGQSIQTQVIIAKNRNGETGRATVLFKPGQTRFVNQARL
jgi:replicative DNA helicase